ncbi:hypothetical protein HMJ29_12795 [Hymenobacter taeanensis]|uniref:DUF7151 domain-containing protein n=1 Tax=Hymenobacter taeanensis TaxID=2735321 RepID=A0A6M6BIC7_9BACT|nr:MULTISPECIES: hypothetical protein [Hymenobacter]QJX47770.1 hypothetical protein HMJ29_12795 [Hymenobacter taeanensis]UOQ82741.1 hypothetical protein MUN83_08270 [Hymenobacter sp. 5414T-23]
MKKLLRVPVALRYWLLPALLLSAATAARAQNNVGIGTTTPDASAVLDASSTTQGMLVPRMTAAQRAAVKDPSTNKPATGLLVYQTDAPAGFYVYNGTAWAALSGAGSTGPAGADGKNSLVRTTAEAAGANCATGGFKTEYGLDANANGTLDAAEVNAALTRYVCNGAQGTAGSTGATGPAGQGVPTGGTAGQVLSKVDGTNYNTQWTTPALSSSGAALQLYAISTTAQNKSPYGYSRYVFNFDNIVSGDNPTAWTTNNTYTVPSSGLYSITLALIESAFAGFTTPPSIAPEIQVVSGGVTRYYYGANGQSSTLYQGNTSEGTAVGTAGAPTSYSRGLGCFVLPLQAGDVIKVFYRSSMNATSTTNTISFSTDGSTYLSIVKLN